MPWRGLWQHRRFMWRGVEARSIALAGLAGGLLAGLADGYQAGLAVGVGPRATAFSALLCGSVDLLLGTALAVLVVTVAGLTRWGWRVAPLRSARTVAWVILGAGAAAGTGAVVNATAGRSDRIIAGTAVALAATTLGVLGALLAPALARALAPLLRRLPSFFSRASHASFASRAPRSSPPPRASRSSPSSPASRSSHTDSSVTSRSAHLDAWSPPPALTPAGLLLLAPAALLICAAGTFALVATSVSPMSEAGRITRIVVAGLIAALLPASLALAATARSRVRSAVAAPAVAALLGVAAVLFLRATWPGHLARLPWRDLRIPAVIALAAAALLPLLTRLRLGRAKVIALLLLAPPLAVFTAFTTGGSEGARIATSRAAGVVTPLLDRVRPALDFDGDGYALALGGGDCNDNDPRVAPGQQDWPEDGIDQDCDGRDLHIDDFRPPPSHLVPAMVPADLNILLVVVDNLRAERLGAYGYQQATSPALDELAVAGTTFDDAWAHAASTALAMPTLITGRWPSAIKWDRFVAGPAIDRGQRTLAEALRAAGYVSGAFYAHSYYNRGNARGFERGVVQYDDRLATLHINVPAGPAALTDLQPAVAETGSSAREMADDGIDFLRAYNAQKFFLTLHFHDPYPRYEPHEAHHEAHHVRGDAARGNDDPDSLDSLYDGEVRFTDRQIGRVIAALRELGIYEKTAIIVTSDPAGVGGGPSPSQAPATRMLARFRTQVPLLLRVPGLSPRRVRAPVGHVDIAPTIINLARAPQELSFIGRSLLDLAAGIPGAAPAPQVVFQESSLSAMRAPTPLSPRALVSSSHHLIADPRRGLAPSCYDRASDPHFSRDLWGLPAGKPACAALKNAFDHRLSLLRLRELPVDFAQRIDAGVKAPGVPVPPPAIARVASFGTAARLLGYDVAVIGAPFPSLGPPPQAPPPGSAGPGKTAIVRIARGGRITVTTHFEVREDLSGWRTFFHLDGPAGTWRNLDHVPVAGAYPVERWRAGQTIRDRFTIEFGPNEAPGLHTLAIGFWHPPATARRRLPVAPAEFQDGQDRLRVISFQVE